MPYWIKLTTIRKSSAKEHPQRTGMLINLHKVELCHFRVAYTILYNYVFFSGCHRFDQSTLAVLLANAYNIINHSVQLCVFLTGYHRFDQSTLAILLANQYSHKPLCTDMWFFQAVIDSTNLQ